MKRTLYLTAILLLALTGCKGEKKIVTYEDFYKETPVNILIGPVEDNARRPIAKTSQDELLGGDLTAAAIYLRQCLADPLLAQGYYTLAPMASDIIVKTINMDYRQLRDQDIKHLGTKYGIDAVLLTAIHKWQQPEINEVVVYVEYILRSTKTGQDLMHTWVRGRKLQPVDTHGEPVELSTDAAFIERNGTESRQAHRYILLQQMSDFALRNLPTSASRWYFQHDRYTPATPAYYGFEIGTDGAIEQTTYTEDAFGNECFTD